MIADVLVTGSAQFCAELLPILRACGGIRTHLQANTGLAVDYLKKRPQTVCIIAASDAHSEEALETARCLRESNVANPRIFIVERSSEALAIAALRAGGHEYFPWPLQPTDLAAACRRLSAAAAPPAKGKLTQAGQVIGRSGAIKSALVRLRRLAAVDCPVLITGETGTGKEIAAQLLHAESTRASHPMVSLNCAAIPQTLLESELFGYERGAFTGAHERRNGALADANHGTVVLDEIGDMEPLAQAKILRAIETKSVQRLGSSRAVPIDVRIVACTHRDLRERVAQGLFREDLFYRLQVARVHMPALRDRPEDISPLARHYLEVLHSKYPACASGIRPDLMRLLQGYAWPGNVRELRNLLESVCLFANGPELTPADLPPEYQSLLQINCANEREKLLYVLKSTDWNKARAARQLNCSRMTLYRKLARHELLNSPELNKIAAGA